MHVVKIYIEPECNHHIFFFLAPMELGLQWFKDIRIQLWVKKKRNKFFVLIYLNSMTITFLTLLYANCDVVINDQTRV
jgi:hypothetical protein